MALAIVTVEEQPEETPIQIPLPDPATIPPWIHAALDRWDTSRAVYLGYDVLKQMYSELQASESQLERNTLRKLRVLAHLWQYTNYRTYITSFEQQILQAEIKALQHPYALKRAMVEYLERDKHGDWCIVEVEEYRHDVDWIVHFIQKRLGSFGVIMGIQQILRTLDSISSVYTICDNIGIDVEIVLNQRATLQKELRKVS